MIHIGDDIVINPLRMNTSQAIHYLLNEGYTMYSISKLLGFKSPYAVYKWLKNPHTKPKIKYGYLLYKHFNILLTCYKDTAQLQQEYNQMIGGNK